MSKFKEKAVPTRKPGIEIGDQIYFECKTGPRTGRVRAAGKHGCTIDCEGEQHKVRWDKVLGHKKRARQRYTILDEGEDGVIVQDAAGQRRYLSVPPNAGEDPLMAKSFNMGGRLVMFTKAGGKKTPFAGRPGLTKKQIVDRTGRQQTKWVRANKDQPKDRQRAAPDERKETNQPSQDPGGGNQPSVSAGDAVRFRAGDFEGEGQIVGTPGADGAHVKDSSGRIHQVRYDELDQSGAGTEDVPGNDQGSGALFSEADLANLPAKVSQPVNTWEALVEKGTEGLEQFREQLGTVAQAMGLRSDKRPDDITPEEWENDTGFLFIAPLKGEKRSREKVEADYDGDWSQLRDIVRATISVPTMGQVKQALGHLKEAGVELAQKPKDRFAKPTAEGYRDLMTIVKLPNGMVAELQIHVKAMTLAKEEGHEHYNVSRSLQAKYNEDEPTDKWSDEDHRAFYDALKAQKDVYGAAWGKATSTATNQQQESSEKLLHKSLAYSKMIMLIRRL